MREWVVHQDSSGAGGQHGQEGLQVGRRVHGRAVVYFAGWKQHYSVYPATARVVGEIEAELTPYELSKGTIRSGPTVPSDLPGRKLPITHIMSTVIFACGNDMD